MRLYRISSETWLARSQQPSGCSDPSGFAASPLIANRFAIGRTEQPAKVNRRDDEEVLLAGRHRQIRKRRLGENQLPGASETRKGPQNGGPFSFMARPEGFEPPTAWFVARYSIQLSYGRFFLSCRPTVSWGAQLYEPLVVNTSCSQGENWRRERDSNPRWAINPYSLSRGALSTTQPSLRFWSPGSRPAAECNSL